jgi:Cys-rich protein (TIGR01571 family)
VLHQKSVVKDFVVPNVYSGKMPLKLLMFFSCCGYLLLISIRTKLREKYGLQEETSDVVAACLFSPFAVCQETREIICREKLPSEKV